MKKVYVDIKEYPFKFICPECLEDDRLLWKPEQGEILNCFTCSKQLSVEFLKQPNTEDK